MKKTIVVVLLIMTLLTTVCIADVTSPLDIYEDSIIKLQQETGVKEITIDNAVYIYYYDDAEIALEKPFGEHLVDTPDINCWIIPEGLDGNVFKESRVFYENADGGRWREDDYTSYYPTFIDKDGKLIDIKHSMNGYYEYAKSKIDGEIDLLKITKRGFGTEGATYIYFESGDNTYVIPLTANEYIECGLVSGELYDAETAKKMFDDKIVGSDEPKGGGSTEESEQPTDTVVNTDEETNNTEPTEDPKDTDDTYEDETITESVGALPEKQESVSYPEADDTDEPKNYTTYIVVGTIAVVVLASVLVVALTLKKKK